MSLGGDKRKLLKRLRELGCDVEHARSGHYRVIKDGRFICTMAVSPSDAHWIKVVERDLRRRGIAI